MAQKKRTKRTVCSVDSFAIITGESFKTTPVFQLTVHSILLNTSICIFTEGYEMDQEESSLQSYASSEEPLSPIIRMERFMLSDIIVNRWVET